MSESGPSRPELMGGNGARAAGVSVPRAEPQATMKMVTLQLQRTTDGNNNEGTIVCSVQCDQAVLCQGSNLIKNLLGTMPEDEPLPPFSTEHIVDGETMRRVVELIELLPSIPEEEMVESTPRSWPTSVGDINIEFRKKFKMYLKQDGNRGEILKVLVAAHYLDCPKIVFACSVYLANAFYVCITNKVAVFGNKRPQGDGVCAAERFTKDGDPLHTVPMPILAEIAERMFVSLNRIDDALEVSSALCVSMAYIDRMWVDAGRCVNKVCLDAKLSSASCKRLLVLEKRLDLRPNEAFPLVRHVGSGKIHERWASLVEKLSTAFVNDDSQWVNGAPAWLMDGMNLDLESCFYTQLMLRRLELKPATTVAVPYFVNATESGKKLLEFAENADSISVALSVRLPTSNTIVPSNVDQLLGNAVNLSAMDIRQKQSVRPPPHETRNRHGHVTRTIEQPYNHPTFPSRWKQLLEVLLVDTMRVEFLTQNATNILPVSLKRLWIRDLHSKETASVVSSVVTCCPDLTDLVFEGAVSYSSVDASVWNRTRKVPLRIWIHSSSGTDEHSLKVFDACCSPMIEVYVESSQGSYAQRIVVDGTATVDKNKLIELPVFFR